MRAWTASASSTSSSRHVLCSPNARAVGPTPSPGALATAPPRPHLRLAPVAAAAPTRAGVIPRAASPNQGQEPNLHPVLEVVNSATIKITNTPALNSFKSWFWGLFAGSYDEGSVRAELEGLVASHPVLVFAWSFSPFSRNARELLDNLGAKYHVVELDRVPRGFALKKELSKMTGRSSVPSIFVKGRHLGGCYDGPGVVPLYRSGELQKLLKSAGAL